MIKKPPALFYDKSDDTLTDDKPDATSDAFKSVEKFVTDHANAFSASARLAALESHNDATWSDLYAVSSKLRNALRGEKRKMKEIEAGDADVRRRFGLSEDLKLDAEEDGEEREARREEEEKEWEAALEERRKDELERERKRWRLEAEVGWAGDERRNRVGSSSTNAGASTSTSTRDAGPRRSVDWSRSVKAFSSYRPRRSLSALERDSSLTKKQLKHKLSTSSLPASFFTSSDSLSKLRSNPRLKSLTSRILLNTARKSDPFLRSTSSGGLSSRRVSGLLGKLVNK